MKIMLKNDEEYREDDLLIKVTDITVKRLPLDPETGLGDDVLRVTLNLEKGDKKENVEFFKEHLNDRPAANFEGYTITMIGGDAKSVELDLTK